MTWKTLNSDVVLIVETFGFRICFEFLISNFEFPDKQKIKYFKVYLVMACPGRGIGLKIGHGRLKDGWGLKDLNGLQGTMDSDMITYMDGRFF